MSTPSARLGALGAAFVLALTPVAPAQRPSLWTTMPLPSGASTPNALGTTVTFTANNVVYLYSGITKAWTTIPVAAGATVFQANDYVIVRDGAVIHGYASHTGKVDTITTSGSPTVVSGPSSSSWVTLVADGTTAYAFGGFHGRWETTTLQNPAPVMTANRLIGLLRDGSTVYAVSAHHGTFVPVAADATATLSVIGEAEVATANSPGVLRAFSAQQNTWGVQVVPTMSGFYQQNEYAMMWAGNQIWAFSGLSGTLATYTAQNPIVAVSGSEGVATFQDGNDVVCYGAGRGAFAAVAMANPTIVYDYHFALLRNGADVLPFSAITTTFGPTLPNIAFVGTNDEIGYAGDGTSIWGYSPILNQWSLAPLTTPSNVTAVRSAVVVGDATGYAAMSARQGTWVFQPVTTAGNFQAPASGATFAAIDGAGETVHVFDARLSRWATVTGAAALVVRVSRHTIMVHDGVTAWGFGQPSSEWYSESMAGGITRFDTASSIGVAVHGGQISVYSVQGSLSYTGRFPEFTQACNLGNMVTMHQVGTPGSLLFLLVGLGPNFYDARPFVDGVVYIDAATLIASLWPQAIDADGILDMYFTVPNNPAFVGLQLHFQNLVLEPAGQPWLSTSVAPVVF